MMWEDRVGQLTELAYIDESDAPYQVDQAGIYEDGTGKFYLLTASGCSCWEGDYDEEVFDSLDALAQALLRAGRYFNPSLRGAVELLRAAVTKLTEIRPMSALECSDALSAYRRVKEVESSLGEVGRR